MRIAVALELEVPDTATLEVIGNRVSFALLPYASIEVIRYEVHPDPDALFPPDGA